ncbi:MAG: hypothetical protein MUF05_06185 [Candidatus Omnitrophica bacterium]|jgi:hypothetical protein|nr:hypothetical protein [Candidatus Omnitrophota bacterium]
MPEKFEDLIKRAHQVFKDKTDADKLGHLDEEVLASLIEKKLKPDEEIAVKKHIALCDDCAGKFLLSWRLASEGQVDLPEQLIAWAKALQEGNPAALEFALELILRLKEEAWEIIHSNGDVLVGNQLLPCAVLRSRNIQDFKDRVVVYRDFKDVRVQVQIDKINAQNFKLHVMIKDKLSQQALKDIRISLLKEDVELESYEAISGGVIFEGVPVGKYLVEIWRIKEKLAGLLIDIRK